MGNFKVINYWNTKDWKLKRLELLGDKCDWCGKSTPPFSLHHKIKRITKQDIKDRVVGRDWVGYKQGIYDEEIERQYNIESDKYRSIGKDDVDTLCKKCHYMWEKHKKKICPKCNNGYMKLGAEMCFECWVQTPDGIKWANNNHYNDLHRFLDDLIHECSEDGILVDVDYDGGSGTFHCPQWKLNRLKGLVAAEGGTIKYLT